MANHCFACDRKLGRKPAVVDTRDDQLVFIGSECAKLVYRSGEEGWQPPKGGPRLYPLPAPPYDAEMIWRLRLARVPIQQGYEEPR